MSNEELAEEVVLEQPEVEEIEEVQDEHSEEVESADPVEEIQDDADEEDVITLHGESLTPEGDEPEAEANWVNALRKSDREKTKKIRELERQMAAKEPVGEIAKTPALGPKPTLESCDFDSDAFEAKTHKWYEARDAVEKQKATAQQEQDAAQKLYQAQLDNYNQSKEKLKVKGFDEAEETVLDSLSETQQNILLHGSEDPALTVYAIGRNPEKAKELAAIKDNVKFAFALAKLESGVKVTKRKVATQPEGRVKGTGSLSGSVESNLKRLEAEANKTGDRTKLMNYKRKQRQKG